LAKTCPLDSNCHRGGQARRRVLVAVSRA
jgi:hypothetical protein